MLWPSMLGPWTAGLHLDPFCRSRYTEIATCTAEGVQAPWLPRRGSCRSNVSVFLVLINLMAALLHYAPCCM